MTKAYLPMSSKMFCMAAIVALVAVRNEFSSLNNTTLLR